MLGANDRRAHSLEAPRALPVRIALAHARMLARTVSTAPLAYWCSARCTLPPIIAGAGVRGCTVAIHAAGGSATASSHLAFPALGTCRCQAMCTLLRAARRCADGHVTLGAFQPLAHVHEFERSMCREPSASRRRPVRRNGHLPSLWHNRPCLVRTGVGPNRRRWQAACVAQPWSHAHVGHGCHAHFKQVSDRWPGGPCLLPN